MVERWLEWPVERWMERPIAQHAVLLVVELAPVFKPLGHPFAKELPGLEPCDGRSNGSQIMRKLQATVQRTILY